MREHPGGGRGDPGPPDPGRLGDDARHREKWRLALDMLDELGGWGLAPPVVVADAGYGDTAEFRDGITARGGHYVVQVQGVLSAHAADAVPEVPPYSGRGRPPRPRYRTKPVALREHVLAAGRAVRLTWRKGSRGPLTSFFVALRVRPAGHRQADRRAADGSLPAVWLLAEWPPEEPEPTDYWLSTLPEDTDLAELVRLAKIRWRIEHDYRELKDRARPGPLRGPHLRRLAPPRHPGHRRSVVHHPAADQPKSGCAGLSLYAVLHELQALLATWTGTCTVYGQLLDTRTRAPT